MTEQLQAQVRALQLEREALVTELAALRMATPGRARPHPTIRFGGGPNLHEFLNQMRMMLGQNRSTLVAEVDRIDFISMHLINGALAWFTALTEIQDPQVKTTAEELLAALKRQYGGIEPGHQANIAIDSIAQGTRSASEYICYFLQLSARSTYDNDALVNALRRGLNPALADRVAYLPRTYDLHTLQKQILDAEIALQERARIRRNRTPGPRTMGFQPRPAMGRHPAQLSVHRADYRPQDQGHNQQEEAMEVEATRRDRECERQRRRDQGLCFYCGQPGHLVQECLLRPSSTYHRGVRLPQNAGTSRPRHLVVQANLTVGTRTIPVRAMIDCGASDDFIDCDLATRLQLPLTRLKKPVTIDNIDGQPNAAGPVQYPVPDPQRRTGDAGSYRRDRPLPHQVKGVRRCSRANLALAE